METDAERTYVEFTLNPKAHFSDGQPVTPQDVLFTWELLKTKGRPNHRTYYSKVARAEQVGTLGVRFTFAGNPDREMPLIMGLMPILPKHATDPETFDQTTLEAMIGSGPYVVDSVDPAARSPIDATRTTGGRTCRPSAASTISTPFGTSSSATTTRCSRPSRRGFTTPGRKTIRRGWRPATTSPP